MTLKWAPLAVAVILGLGCAAAGGEEPAPAPAPEPVAAPAYPPAPATPATGGDSPYEDAKSWGWGLEQCYPSLPFSATLMFLLAPVILGFFISGLIKHRHDWKPLVLGLFALGLGALATSWRLADSFNKLANMAGACGPGDACYATAVALGYLIWGLIIVLAGGLFTVILRWRNARRNDPGAEEASESEAEAVEGGDSWR